MARDDGMAQVYRLVLLRGLDGIRPSGIPEWVSPVAPAVTQAAVGGGHWAAGRRRRALAAWASAAGFALTAWGLGTEEPTRTEADKKLAQQKGLLRERGVAVPGPGGMTPGARQMLRYFPAVQVAGTVLGVRSG